MSDLTGGCVINSVTTVCSTLKETQNHFALLPHFSITKQKYRYVISSRRIVSRNEVRKNKILSNIPYFRYNHHLKVPILRPLILLIRVL